MTGIYLSIAIALGGALFLNRNQAIRRLLVVCFTLLQVGFTVYSFLHPGASGEAFFRADALGLLMLGVLTIISIPAVIHSEIYLSNPRETNRTRAIYCAALILLITAMGAACLSSHIAVTWIFVELTTLSASALIYHHRNERSLEGTWKYVFLCAISVTFIFIGILFLSLALRQTGTTDLSYEQLMLHASALDPSWLKLAFLFIFTGFTAKMGLVPMYTAGIDAKDKAPAPAGALFSSVLMNMGFVGLPHLRSDRPDQHPALGQHRDGHLCYSIDFCCHSVYDAGYQLQADAWVLQHRTHGPGHPGADCRRRGLLCSHPASGAAQFCQIEPLLSVQPGISNLPEQEPARHRFLL